MKKILLGLISVVFLMGAGLLTWNLTRVVDETIQIGGSTQNVLDIERTFKEDVILTEGETLTFRYDVRKLDTANDYYLAVSLTGASVDAVTITSITPSNLQLTNEMQEVEITIGLLETATPGEFTVQFLFEAIEGVFEAPVAEEEPLISSLQIPYFIDFTKANDGVQFPNNTNWNTWLEESDDLEGFSSNENLGDSYSDGSLGFGRGVTSSLLTLITPEVNITQEFKVTLDIRGNSISDNPTLSVKALNSDGLLVANGLTQTDNLTEHIVANPRVFVVFNFNTLEEGFNFEDIFKIHIIYDKTGAGGNLSLYSILIENFNLD